MIIPQVFKDLDAARTAAGLILHVGHDQIVLQSRLHLREESFKLLGSHACNAFRLQGLPRLFGFEGTLLRTIQLVLLPVAW